MFALMECEVLSSLIPLKSSEHVHDKVVHLGEHHEVNRQTGAPVLGRRVARQPGEGVVLLQNKSVVWKEDCLYTRPNDQTHVTPLILPPVQM